MRKIISIILISSIIILSTLFPTKIYATDDSTTQDEQSTTQSNEDTSSQESSSNTGYTYQTAGDVEKEGIKGYTGIIEKGQANVNGEKRNIKENAGMIETVMKWIVKLFSYVPYGIQIMISTVTSPYTEGYTGEELKLFTIQDTVFGKISLFDINFFDTKTGDADNPNTKIKNLVASWYNIIRDLSLIVSLIVLVYMGVKMAISTIASDKAKYKGMLFAWTKSFIIIFILPYLLMFIISLANTLVSIIPPKETSEGFETKLTETIEKKLDEESVLSATGALINFILLVYYQLKFFVKYLVRFFKTAFLIIISPLITITYSLDKGKAHNNWLAEFISVVFMQLIHALIFSVFMFSASAIIEKIPILAIAFFMALSRGERIFNYVFRLRNN